MRPTKKPPLAKAGRGANRSAKQPAVAEGVSDAARELARLLIAPMADKQLAAALAEEMPEIAAAILRGAKSNGPTAVADRALLMRVAGHPAATAADATKAGRAGAVAVLDRIGQAMARAEQVRRPMIEGASEPVPAPVGRAPVTAAPLPRRKLPF